MGTYDTTTLSTELMESLLDLEHYVKGYLHAKLKLSRAHLAQALAMEATLLNVKVSYMRDRWKRFIPFHEVIDVKFGDWAETVEEWIAQLGAGKVSLPSMKYMQDCYMALQTGDPVWKVESTDVASEVEEYCARVDAMLRQMEKTQDTWWPNLEQYVLEKMGVTTVMIANTNDCIQVLRQLQQTLQQIHDMFNEPIEEIAFQRHGMRLVKHYCKNQSKRVDQDYSKWLNACPKKMRKEKGLQKKEELIQKLREREACKTLEEYIDYDMPLLNEDSSFGQFLYCNRHGMKGEDVQFIFKTCSMICKLNDLLGIKKPKHKGRELDEAEQQILSRINEFCERMDWCPGYTAKGIREGWRMALGLAGPLSDKEKKQSEELWSQLKDSRKKGYPEESFKITWLYFVGWCQHNGLVEGNGRQLCNRFYHGENDYKIVNKAAGNSPAKRWTDLYPLLTRCFLGKIEC